MKIKQVLSCLVLLTVAFSVCQSKANAVPLDVYCYYVNEIPVEGKGAHANEPVERGLVSGSVESGMGEMDFKNYAIDPTYTNKDGKVTLDVPMGSTVKLKVFKILGLTVGKFTGEGEILVTEPTEIVIDVAPQSLFSGK